ncbi:hypothetical protein B0T24DRAFT_377466 [Lasiosphaeria ovina]|uniref:Uncharacterized protein n=1 Tax=Lasiosphaeria ovina TaxID=92902 RepID=A0AAE0N1Q6_9PEZI|nr:hypothetical protein B0T24DRAFT_377466 [Lasiosphaeria ovina]
MWAFYVVISLYFGPQSRLSLESGTDASLFCRRRGNPIRVIWLPVRTFFDAALAMQAHNHDVLGRGSPLLRSFPFLGYLLSRHQIQQVPSILPSAGYRIALRIHRCSTNVGVASSIGEKRAPSGRLRSLEAELASGSWSMGYNLKDCYDLASPPIQDDLGQSL